MTSLPITLESCCIVFSFWASGTAILRFLPGESWSPWPFNWARSWVMGTGIVALHGLVFSALAIPFVWSTTAILWSLAWLLSMIFKKKGRSDALTPNRQGVGFEKALWWVFWCYAIYWIITTLWMSIERPIHASDSVFIYGLNARSYELSLGVSKESLEALRVAGHIEYPPLFPLLESLFFQADGLRGAHTAMLLPSLYGVCFLFCVFHWTSRRLGVFGALAITILVTSTPEILHFSRRGYADIPLATYWLCFLIHLASVVREPRSGSIYAAALFLGFAALTKNEGVGMALLLLPIATMGFVSRRTRSLTVRGALIAIPLIVMWPLWRAMSGLSVVDLVDSSVHRLLSIDRIIEVLTLYGDTLIRQNPDATFMWGIFWIAMAIFTALGLSKLRSPSRLWFLAAIYFWLSHTLLYLIVLGATGHDLSWQIQTALLRLLLHTIPSAMAVIVFSIELWKQSVQASASSVQG